MNERREGDVKADRLMALLARPPDKERASTNEQELKWNIERRRAVEAQRQTNRFLWLKYHARLAEHHQRLANEHLAQAEALDEPDEAASDG